MVGTWLWTSEHNHHVLDRGAAKLLAGNPDLADTELPLEAVISCIHPDDQALVLAVVERAERESGLYVVEYRVRARDGTRWLLDHGRVYPATASMPAHGHGVLIDVTQQKLHGAESEADNRHLSPLDRAARHVIAARKAIDEDGSNFLRQLVDMLLWELGRTIARRLRAARNKAMN
ncbi:PAS domain-containing protein [Methylobacterium soli]|uniref:PAS domain-containing protein n=1 Tax=Methylobacterium soli TaxID=553447 RepID=UPI001784F5F1|nr:PAS domain-containing protein [Methylobacterium soli]